MYATKSIKRGFQLYFSSALVYSIGILILNYVPYYENYLKFETRVTILILYLSYIILSPLYYLTISKEYSTNKPFLAIKGSKTIISHYLLQKGNQLEKEEKTAILFILVKLFFLPLMLNFFFQNLDFIMSGNHHYQWYPLALTLIFTIDTLVFSFGYTFEFRALKNMVKSVEPTFLGWFVALICYPPFNSMVGGKIPWGANDHVNFGNPLITTVMRIILVVLFMIYLWATFALNTKASNLTNRGIVAKFPYSIIRHPAYISKNLVWWLTLLPVLSWKFALGMFFWSIIYFFRALTEERHLKQDPDYVEYCKKVKYRFIPYLF